MNNLYNTSFENSLRVLLLLTQTQNSLTIDKITAWDFIAVNGKLFGLTEFNLHGENSFTLCEYTARRELISFAVKELVLKGLIAIENGSNGFCYKVTENGNSIANNFQTNYANEYKNALQHTARFCLEKTEQQLINFISKKTMTKTGDNQ